LGYQIKYRLPQILAYSLSLLLFCGAPTFIHGSGLQEESEVEVKSSHFQSSQERRGCIPKSNDTFWISFKLDHHTRNDQIDHLVMIEKVAYLLYQQWMFYG